MMSAIKIKKGSPMTRYFATAPLPEPHSLSELKERLALIQGRSVAELTSALGLDVPAQRLGSKGYIGELIELYLGAAAQNLSLPDFPHLGIELKTVPIDANFQPRESTFICHAPLNAMRGLNFFDSSLYHKLRLTLYVFILSGRSLPLAQHRVIDYQLHALGGEELAQVQRDFEELMELIAAGKGPQITARVGTIVQMRPKAADGRQVTSVVNVEGGISATRPRGFYLRRAYTQKICALAAARHHLPLQTAM